MWWNVFAFPIGALKLDFHLSSKHEPRLDHDCRNSIIFRFKTRFEAFLRKNKEETESMPATCDELWKTAGINIAHTKQGIFFVRF